jgi:cytochrome c peroxidase
MRPSAAGAIAALLGLIVGAAASAQSAASAQPTARPHLLANAATASAAPESTTTSVGPAYDWRLPRGFPAPVVPADNPMSVAKVALGRRLFAETRLSVMGRHSCASCHAPALAYTDGRATAVGATGGDVGRATMSLANVAYAPRFGWFEGGAETLEAQMHTPLFNDHPVEIGLGGREREVVDSLRADPEYARGFATAFPGDASPITIDNVIRAIAAFERTLISGGSPFDRYAFGGEHEAIDARAKRGMELFYSPRLGCGACHGGFAFAGPTRDARRPDAVATYANDGTSERPIRVPTLRNVALTAPYMHDGRYATLEDVIAHYERLGVRAGSGHRPFQLDDDERAALLAFLRALTDPEFVTPR